MLKIRSKLKIVILLTVFHLIDTPPVFATGMALEDASDLITLPIEEVVLANMDEEVSDEMLVTSSSINQNTENTSTIIDLDAAQNMPSVDVNISEVSDISPAEENNVAEPEPFPTETAQPETPVETPIESPPVTDNDGEKTPIPVAEPAKPDTTVTTTGAEESINQPLSVVQTLATQTIELPLTIYRQEGNSGLTGLYFLSEHLPLNAQVLAAQIVFTNSSSSQKLETAFTVQAEQSSSPVALSDKAPLTNRNLTAAYVNVNPAHNTRWAQGTEWTIDVSKPVQQIGFPLAKPAIVLLAKTLTNTQAVFNGYTLNDDTVKLQIVVVKTGDWQWWSPPSVALNTTQLSALNRTMAQTKFQNSQNSSVQFSQQLLEDTYCLVAEDKQLTRYRFAANFIDTQNQTSSLQIGNNLTYLLDTGELIHLQPLIQNLIAFKSALNAMGKISFQAKGASYSVTVDEQAFRLIPDLVSIPVKVPSSYQATLNFVGVDNNIYTFALLFSDERGQWRQQLIFILP